MAGHAPPRKALTRPSFLDVPDARRRNLAAVKAKDTKPELVLRRALHRRGYRFRLHDGQLPGRPDLVFPGRRAVIEVRGCFWHLHGCSNSVLPKTRRDWWAAKLKANVARDEANVATLRAAGWRVLVVWECDIRRDVAGVVSTAVDFLAASNTDAPSRGG